MFRGTLSGIDDVFETDIAPGSIVCVVGPPGSMKSSFIYNVMSLGLKKQGKYGMYLTLEQDKASHERNMASIGIPKYEGVYTYDYTSTRAMMSGGEAGGQAGGAAADPKSPEITEMIKHIISANKKRLGDKFNCFALDSMTAVYALTRSQRDMRTRIYNFFKFLRDNGLTSFIILEKPRHGSFEASMGTESFLADGVIEMGFVEMRNTMKPYLQVTKMRACKHSRDRFSVHVEKNGLMLTREVFE